MYTNHGREGGVTIYVESGNQYGKRNSQLHHLFLLPLSSQIILAILDILYKITLVSKEFKRLW